MQKSPTTKLQIGKMPKVANQKGKNPFNRRASTFIQTTLNMHQQETSWQCQIHIGQQN
jgi:hypothetical protein